MSKQRARRNRASGSTGYHNYVSLPSGRFLSKSQSLALHIKILSQDQACDFGNCSYCADIAILLSEVSNPLETVRPANTAAQLEAFLYHFERASRLITTLDSTSLFSLYDSGLPVEELDRVIELVCPIQNPIQDVMSLLRKHTVPVATKTMLECLNKNSRGGQRKPENRVLERLTQLALEKGRLAYDQIIKIVPDVWLFDLDGLPEDIRDPIEFNEYNLLSAKQAFVRKTLTAIQPCDFVNRI